MEAKYDLGKDGVFTKFTILIGCFYHGEGMIDDIKNVTAIPDLNRKGFQNVNLVMYEDEFIDQLKTADQAWIISGNEWHRGSESMFVELTRLFVNSGKGLMIYADNDPFFLHATKVLKGFTVGRYEEKPINI